MSRIIRSFDYDLSLGEGPIWDYKNERLLWIDIIKKLLYVNYFRENKTNKYKLKGNPGTVVPYSENEVLIAIDTSIYLFHLIKKEYRLLNSINADNSKIRFNDGKCDK